MLEVAGNRKALLISAIVSLTTAVILFTGCAGEDSGKAADERRAIENVTWIALIPQDSDGFCESMITDELLEAVYGNVERCQEVRRHHAATSGAYGESNPIAPGNVIILNVEGDDRAVEVKFREDGGAASGVESSVYLINDKGSWKLDRFNPGYGREKTKASFLTFMDAVVDGKYQNLPQMKAFTGCIVEEINKTSDVESTDVLYRTLGTDGGEGSQPELFDRIAETCEHHIENLNEDS